MEFTNQQTMTAVQSNTVMHTFPQESYLLETSNDLFCQGWEKEARHILKANAQLYEDAPDLYLEEEGDQGPRAFRLPSFSRECREASIVYNRALIHQARNELVEATRLFEHITRAPTNPSLSIDLAVIKMRSHNNLGHIFYTTGTSFYTALEQFTLALRIAHTLTGSYTLDLATILSNWCRVHFMKGDVDHTVYEGLYEVLRLRSSVLPWDHTDIASAHYNLGVMEYSHNDGQKAVGHLMKYLQIVAAGASKNRSSSKMAMDPIPALIYILLVKNEDKEDSLSQEVVRGLRTFQEMLADSVGQELHDITSLLNFIGTLLFHQRDFEHALLFFQEELRLEEACVSDGGNNTIKDISVSVTCNNIARILQELQRLPEAKFYYFRSLIADYGTDIQSELSLDSKKNVGSASFFCDVPLQSGRRVSELPAYTINLYSTVWYNLGLIHDKQGAYKEAIHAFQMSVSLRRVMLGPDHADVACLLYNIGVLQMEQSFLTEATLSLKEALRIRRATPSSSLPSGQLNDCHIVKTLQKLASLHKTKGRIHDALQAQMEIFQIQCCTEEFPSTNLRHKDMAATTREMAELYHALGDLALAVEKANGAAALIRQTHRVLPSIDTESSDRTEFIACMEEMVAILLLLGSLKHEAALPDEARVHFREASVVIQQASSYFNYPTELGALQEVTKMLATAYCASVA